MLPLFILTAILYAVASFSHGLDRGGEGRRPMHGRWLWVAMVAHFATIGAQCVDGVHPFRSIYLVLSVCTWAATLVYLVFGLMREQVRGGVGLLAPLGLLGLTLGVVMGPASGGAAAASSRLLTVHVSLASAGLVGFVLASAVAGLYLWIDYRLRHRRGLPTAGGQSLQRLERIQYALMVVVAPVFTLAVVTGVLVLQGAEVNGETQRRTVELAAAAVAWAASLAVLGSRFLWGLRGKRAAVLTLLGLAAVVIIIVSYGVRS